MSIRYIIKNYLSLSRQVGILLSIVAFVMVVTPINIRHKYFLPKRDSGSAVPQFAQKMPDFLRTHFKATFFKQTGALNQDQLFLLLL